VQDFRVDERERQRARRERLRTDKAACHAPASPSKCAELIEKVLESWDELIAMSRAGLRRRLAVISQRSVGSAETSRDEIERMSRASLGP
jgi:ribosomal protein L22